MTENYDIIYTGDYFMIFKNNRYKSYQYELDSDIKGYSRYGLCKEIQRVVDLISDDINDGIVVEGINGDIISEVAIDIANRSVEDIYNIIFVKKYFRDKLGLLGIKNIDEDDNYDYLKIIYFFYIMEYIIYPKEKFFDLFKEKNWSAENIRGANTGNEKYQLYIEELLCNAKEIQDDIAVYEGLYQEYQEVYFEFFERRYWKYCDKFDCIGLIMDDRLNEVIIDLYNFIVENSDIVSKEILAHNEKKSLFYLIASNIKKYEATCTVNDLKNNVENIDYDKLYDISLDVDEILDEYYDIFVSKIDVDKYLEDEEFKCLCMGVSKMNNTLVGRYNSYNLKDTLMKVWEIDSFQLDHSDEEDIFFTFLEEIDGEYKISLVGMLVVCICRIEMPYTMKYISKHIRLKNRSDASKRNTHSIKESYKVSNSDDFIASESVLRDGVFRMCCITLFNFLHDGADEFFYFEYPENMLLMNTQLLVENLPYICQRNKWFARMIEILRCV